MAGHVGDRARSWVAVFLERMGFRRAAGVPDAGAAVRAEAGGNSEPAAAAEPDFGAVPAEPVTVESLRRVLDGLRQLS